MRVFGFILTYPGNFDRQLSNRLKFSCNFSSHFHFPILSNTTTCKDFPLLNFLSSSHLLWLHSCNAALLFLWAFNTFFFRGNSCFTLFYDLRFFFFNFIVVTDLILYLSFVYVDYFFWCLFWSSKDFGVCIGERMNFFNF